MSRTARISLIPDIRHWKKNSAELWVNGLGPKEPHAVDLANVDSLRLQKLLEGHPGENVRLFLRQQLMSTFLPVMSMLSGSNAHYSPEPSSDLGMPENIIPVSKTSQSAQVTPRISRQCDIRCCWFFDEPEVVF